MDPETDDKTREANPHFVPAITETFSPEREMKQHHKITSRQFRRASALVSVLIFTSLVLFAIISTASYALHRRMETVRLTLHGAELAAAENALERSYALLYFASQRRPSQIRLGNGIEGFVEEVIERGGDDGAADSNDGFQIEIIAVPLPGYTDDEGSGKIVLIDQEAINDLGPELEPWRDFQMQVSGYQVIAGARARDVRTTNGESAFPFQTFISRPAVYVSKNLVQYSVPLLNYAIFYENEFELDAGQRIDVRGKVHTNSDWYLTTSSSAYYHDYITVAGNLYGGVYHPGDHARRSWSGKQDVFITDRRLAQSNSPNTRLHNGQRGPNRGWLSSVLYNNTSTGPPKLINGDPAWDPNPNWVDESIGLFKGFLKDSSHGVLPVRLPLDEQQSPRLLIEAPLPPSGNTANPNDMLNDSKLNVNLAYKAGLIIETKPGFATASSANWPSYVEAYRWVQTGTDPDTGLPILTKEPVSIEYNRIKPGSFPPVMETVRLVDRVSIYNGREEKNVTLLDFKTGRMAEFLKLHSEWATSGDETIPNPNANPDLSVPLLTSPTGEAKDDGIVYFDVDQSGLPVDQQVGTRLSEATYQNLNDITLRDGRTDADKRGLSFGTNGPMYTLGHLNHDPSNANNRIPLMIAGDAINILSAAFKDSDYATGKGDGPRKGANPTTTNAVFVSGNVPSGKGQYSGGGENFFRYIEAWGGNNAHTFSGSMLNLFESEVATAPWDKDPNTATKSGYYDPPRRIWGWDTRFADAANAPPGIPTSYNVSVGRWQLVSSRYYQQQGGDESLAINPD
jgi:hypothetical protein